MIAQQSGANCVARALSTMRLALGYGIAVPAELEQDIGPKSALDVVNSLNTWFPEHKPCIFCSTDVVDVAKDKSSCAGANWNMSETEVDNYIIAFSYYTTNDEISHFVIGVPTLYEGMNTSMIVCVPLKRT